MKHESEYRQPAAGGQAHVSELGREPADGASAGVSPALRARAEGVAAAQEPFPAAEYSVEDILALTHELQVHQIELELQNEELRRAQLDLQITAERYADLYEFAPVGYLSVDPDGLITQGNLTAAALLGVERRELRQASFNRFIFADDTALFHQLRRRLNSPRATQSLELRLHPRHAEPFWARLEVISRADPIDGALRFQIAFNRIEEQKRAEQLLRRLNEELEERVTQRTHQLMRANRELIEEIARREEAEAALREREETLEARVAERTAELASLLAVSQEISATLDIDKIFAIILEHLEQAVRYTSCGIFLLHGELLTLVAYRGPLPSRDVIQSQTTLDQSPLLQVALAAGKPLIVDDLAADEALPTRWRERAGVLQRRLLGPSRSWLGIPLLIKGRPIGVLRLDHRDPGHFTQHHSDMAFTLANQTAVAVENARLYAQAQNVAAIEERQRLARELHDSVAQTFYSISLSIHSATAQVERNPERARRHLDRALELAGAGLTEMRALIFDLQAENIRREGLVGAIQRQLSALTARNDVRIVAELGNEPDAPFEVKEAAYGIVREALQNVVRHAGATLLSVRVGHANDRLTVEVRDDGVGFAPGELSGNTYGLRSMRERAALIGGSIEVASRPLGGTVVRAEIPLNRGKPPER